MPGRLLCILFMALLAVVGCSNSDVERQEILKTIATRSSALNSRNISQYITVVSPHYNDKGKNITLLKESLENNFRDFEQISYKCGVPTITIAGRKAESVNTYRMKVHVRGKEVTLNGTEHLKLEKEQEGWKIIAGI